MSGDVPLRVEKLGKRYNLGLVHQDRLADALAAGVRWIGSGLRRSSVRDVPRQGPAPDHIWALRNVSFEVRRGEVLGIIGRNGAGKSTLLRILTRITEPTEGRARLYGRVASLLEVGTGFHPELTGRENVFLNGAVLGMRRREVRHKLDAIVSFAGEQVAKFVDTPVKRYSSGMYVRLAFAVAAHLEPEILLVDEVLAVGDLEFQRKCLGKMREVTRGGRTVLFVSHNMNAVRRLCDRVLLLEDGRTALLGEPDAVVARYQACARDREASGPIAPTRQPPEKSEGVSVTSVELVQASVATWDDVTFRVVFESDLRESVIGVDLWILTAAGDPILMLPSHALKDEDLSMTRGRNAVRIAVPRLPLAAGEYLIAVGVSKPNSHYFYRHREFAWLTVEPRDVYKTGFRFEYPGTILVTDASWEREEMSE